MDMDITPAILVLEDGRSFLGESFGVEGEVFGEARFFTGMTGYQEALTDPARQGQIMIATAPHVGNTGWNEEDGSQIQVAGLVVRDPSPRPSSWRATSSLHDQLAAHGVLGISGIDTRALTRRLRDGTVLKAAISTTDLDPASVVARLRGSTSAKTTEQDGANHG